jgi:hypothetical protein
MNRNKRVHEKVSRKQKYFKMIVVLISIKITCNPTEGINLDLDDITRKVENLKIKNNIGYHFKKKVRQVAQELFISRKMDTTLLIQGIDALKQIALKLGNYCSEIPSKLISLKESESKTLTKYDETEGDRFVFLSQIKEITFIEAKARCQALGKQLPEIYDEHSMQMLSMLMRNKKVSTVWAGIQFDPNTAIQIFISTGMPIYRGFSKLQVYHQGKSASMRLFLMNLTLAFYMHIIIHCVSPLMKVRQEHLLAIVVGPMVQGILEKKL